MNIEREIVDELRKMAAADVPPSAMVMFLVQRFGRTGAGRLRATLHFKEAFGLSLKDAITIGAWHEYPQATWTAEMLDTALLPLIRKK